MAVAGAATALSTAVGSLTAHVLPAAVLALAIWGAVAGLLAGAGPAATVVGVQAVVGLVVLGRFPLTPAGAAAAAGEVLLGSAGQVLLCALLRAPARHLVERRALARLADDLARWCRDPGGSWTSSTASGLEDARTLLQRRPDAPAVSPLRSVLLGLARSRLEVSVLCVAHERSAGHQQARIGRLLAAAAVDLGRFAEVLRTGQEGGAPGDQSPRRCWRTRSAARPARRTHRGQGSSGAARPAQRAHRDQRSRKAQPAPRTDHGRRTARPAPEILRFGAPKRWPASCAARASRSLPGPAPDRRRARYSVPPGRTEPTGWCRQVRLCATPRLRRRGTRCA